MAGELFGRFLDNSLLLTQTLFFYTRIEDRPFQKLQEGSSRSQYEMIVVRLLSFLLRPYDDSYHLGLGEKSKSQQSIDKLKNALYTEPPNALDIQKCVQNLLMCIWGCTWKKTKENTIGDPTICWLALAMLRHDQSFQSPQNTTPYISQLKYSLRLVMLIAIKHQASEKYTEDLKAAEKYEPWFTEKHDSTFNTLCTMQKYASALARAEPGLPHVVWMDRTHFQTMRFKGNVIEFNKLTTLFSNIEDHAIYLWENDVLMNLLSLKIQYSQLTDDMGNTEVGYSFLTDKRNKCFSNRDALATAILKDSTLSKRFLTGETDNEGQPVWSRIELQKWLYSYSLFHGALITSADIKGGSPSRGTEVQCIQYMNTATRNRGLYMMGNHLAIICQYHKTAAITGKDKLIPHSLDAVTSDLLIQDLAIARPFAELAAYICYPHDLDVQSKYHSYLFVNNKELFDTPDLTKLLKTYTLPVFDTAFGVADWRHISAAFRRKICPAMNIIIEDDETQESVQALQSGHSRRTENHLYGISAEALAGSPEDVLPLFLDASTDWQVACKIVPGGHLLSYTTARAANFDFLASKSTIKSNYTTPVRTMEQVMDRITFSLDNQLQKQTQTLQKTVNDQIVNMFAAIESKISTELGNVFETKIKSALDQMTNALISS